MFVGSEDNSYGATATATFTMTGGEISGNTSPHYGKGGGVFVLVSATRSRFEKTGGIITGYSSDPVNGNVVKNYTNDVIIANAGHAVCVAGPYNYGSIIIRRKETTAGQGDNLTYINNDPQPPTISGAW